MKIYALPLLLSLIIFSKCAKDWDKDRRQTGGGGGGGGESSKLNISHSHVDPKGLHKLKLKQVGNALRSRRTGSAGSDEYFFIGHQLMQFHADIKEEQVCFDDSTKTGKAR